MGFVVRTDSSPPEGPAARNAVVVTVVVVVAAAAGACKVVAVVAAADSDCHRHVVDNYFVLGTADLGFDLNNLDPVLALVPAVHT